MKQLTLTRPDDWHVHLRDGDVLRQTVAASSRCFRRAIVMPNLKPPATTTALASAYRQRILDAAPTGSDFQPLMTLYLTDTMPVDEIHRAQASGLVQAVKYYPAGATTNADNGVTAIEKVYPVLQAMAETGMPLLIHGEATAPEIDIFDREAVFIEQTLKPLRQAIPDLKIVLEHITTAQAVEYVTNAAAGIAATLTVQHLLYNRNHLLSGGIRPHLYCLPVLKRNSHQQALLQAACSGNPRFFLGTDSAPHSRQDKEQSCGCAGCFTAHAALELYTEIFEAENALDKLEAFASFNGPDFYGLPRNTEQITLYRKPWQMPAEMAFAQQSIIPLRAGETLQWQLLNETRR
ncbi:MAG: dihydroorotase [Pseudomonadales bacterium]|nr:dihydroorotase [Pseudomonadales bacterium]